MATYQLGNTVRLTAIFSNWANQVVTPTLVKVLVYGTNWVKLFEQSLGIDDTLEDGSYYYDYTIPSSTKGRVLYIEWYAEIEGTPSIKRVPLNIDQI